VFLGFLTPVNRDLLAAIRDRKPRSIAELAEMTGLGEPALAETLAKLEAVGFVRMEMAAGRKLPVVAVTSIRVEIDPFSLNDRVEMV